MTREPDPDHWFIASVLKRREPIKHYTHPIARSNNPRKTCPQCGERYVLLTDFWGCPNGHGKLVRGG